MAFSKLFWLLSAVAITNTNAVLVSNAAGFISALSSGATSIVLAPGTYIAPGGPTASSAYGVGGFTVTTANTVISAQTPGSVEIICRSICGGSQQSLIGLNVNAANVQVSGVKVSTCATGIYVDRRDAKFDNVVVYENWNSGLGVAAGVHVMDTGDNAVITNSIIRDSLGYAGIYSYAPTITLKDSLITNFSGDAFKLNYGAVATIQRTRIVSNDGSGLSLARKSLADVSNCNISYNNVYSGAAFYVDDSTINVKDSTVIYNTAKMEGGGVWYANDNGHLIISNSIVDYNSPLNFNFPSTLDAKITSSRLSSASSESRSFCCDPTNTLTVAPSHQVCTYPASC